MKIICIPFFFLFFYFLPAVKAQPYKYIYYFDKELNSCKKSKSNITGKGFYDGSHLKLDYFSNTSNNLLMSVYFTNSTLSSMDGLFQSYYNGNSLEKEGNYVHDIKEGMWQEWNKEGRKTDSSIYLNGVQVKTTKFYYNKKGGISHLEFIDSLQNTMSGWTYNENGMLTYEKKFVGQKGVLKFYDSSGVRIDSVFTTEEIEATYPGGDRAWRTYLERNLNVEVPGNNKAPAGTYTLILKYMVSKDGTIKNIEIENYIGYGMEQECIRILNKSPKWIPAKQYGRPVNAYRRQPITFVVQRK